MVLPLRVDLVDFSPNGKDMVMLEDVRMTIKGRRGRKRLEKKKMGRCHGRKVVF